MVNDLYLAHHGIPGQKWGKKNGPPYPLDEKKYSSAEKKAANITNSRMFKAGKDGKPSPAEKITKSTQDIINNSSKLSEKAFQKKNQKTENKKKETISKLSDEELRKVIQRMELEKKYSDLSPKTISKGQEWTREFFEIAGSTAGILASMATIMTAINKKN